MTKLFHHRLKFIYLCRPQTNFCLISKTTTKSVLIKIEKRIQLAFKELLIKETWNYLKTHNNYERVLSIASLIDKYDPGPDPCYEDCTGICALDVMMATHFLLTGEIVRISEVKNHLVNLTEHELTMLVEAIDDKIHKCDEWCSKFVCYKYPGKTCAKENCSNLFLKTTKNMKYCNVCRHNLGIIFHEHYKPAEEWVCYCKRFM